MRALFVANAILLAAAIGWLATFALPVRRAVRARNAFLLRVGGIEEFAWTPESVPEDFRVERAGAPEDIAAAVSVAGITAAGEDWPRARSLVAMLTPDLQREGALQTDLESTLRGIVRGGGQCVDYVRVYLAAAHAVGLFCRQWAFSFDGSGARGHTFVELFDRQRGRWIFLDVYNNVYAVLAGSEEPLAALALRSALVNAPASVEFRRVGPGRLGYPDFNKLLDYYRRGVGHWYLWWGNDVISRERSGVVGALRHVSGRWAYRIDSAIGHPSLVAVITPENRPQVAQMESLRRQMIRVAFVAAGLALLLGLQFAADLSWASHDRR